MKITQQQAVMALTDMLEAIQNTKIYKTGFGHGFHRWILSVDIKTHLNNRLDKGITYADIRKTYKALAECGIIEIKQSRSYGMLEYSMPGWDDCRNIGDYFIENEN